MKKKILCVLIGVIVMAAFTACNKETKPEKEPQKPEKELTAEEANKLIQEGNQVDLTFNGYEEELGAIILTNLAGEENQVGGMGYIAAEGMKVSDVLLAYDVKSVEAVHEMDSFEGWMEYEVVVKEEADYVTEEYVRTAEDLLTTEQVLEKVIPSHNVMYVAKWKEVPEENYFADEQDMENVEPDYSFTLDAGGGVMTFAGEQEYEGDMYTYYWKNGKSLADAMDGEWDDPLDEIRKKGKTFDGWTVYVGDSVDWPYEMTDVKGAQTFQISGEWYIQVNNCQVYGEQVSTEELLEIVCEENCYYAVANWK